MHADTPEMKKPAEGSNPPAGHADSQIVTEAPGKAKPLRLSPREFRVAYALAGTFNWVSREQLDRIAGASNGPDVVFRLRGKLGEDAIEMRHGDARALMLHCARMLLGWLRNIDNERERMSDAGTWRDEDFAIDLAVCHAFDCVRRLIEEAPERKAFEAQWWNFSGVVTLAVQAFPNKDTAYWRMLDGADNGMQTLPWVWQTVADGIPQREPEAGHGT